MRMKGFGAGMRVPEGVSAQKTKPCTGKSPVLNLDGGHAQAGTLSPAPPEKIQRLPAATCLHLTNKTPDG